MTTKIPSELLYTKDDEWVRIEGEEAVIGITDHAQDSLSDIVYLELPAEGDTFAAGEVFGVVESVKAAADLYMPIGGTVTAVNDGLLDTPEMVNEAPYDDAWLVRIAISNMDDVADLLDAAAYAKSIEERE